MSDSKYIIRKEHKGTACYKNWEGQEVEFLYEVRICPSKKCPTDKQCLNCSRFNDTPLREDELRVRLGEGLLHKFIEDTLLTKEIRRGCGIVFFLSAKDAFEDIGAKDKDDNVIVPPDKNICCYLVEPM